MTMVVRLFINILRIFKKLVEKYGIESGSEGIIVEFSIKIFTMKFYNKRKGRILYE